MKIPCLLAGLILCISINVEAQDIQKEPSKFDLQIGAVANSWIRTFDEIKGDKDLIQLSSALDVKLGLRTNLGYQINQRFKTWLSIELGMQNNNLIHSFPNQGKNGGSLSTLRDLGRPLFIQMQIGLNYIFWDNGKSHWYIGSGYGSQIQNLIDKRYEHTPLSLTEGNKDFFEFNNKNARFVSHFKALLGYSTNRNSKIRIFAEVFYSQAVSASLIVTRLGYDYPDRAASASISFQSGFINPGLILGIFYNL